MNSMQLAVELMLLQQTNACKIAHKDNVLRCMLCFFSTRLSKGDPSAYLPIVSFTLTSFSPPFAEQLIASGLELTGKTDLRFIDTLYKVMH